MDSVLHELAAQSPSAPAMPAVPTTLDALFAPRSVAIVGASDDPTRISGRALRYLREARYPGELYPVNPTRTLVQGLPAFDSLASLPGVPDVVLVAVSAERAVGALEDAAELGVKGAIVFSSGFAERGDVGAAQQRRIGELAAARGMRILGPNCLGAFNARDRFFGTFAIALDRALPSGGPVAIASQSGAYGTHLYSLAERRRLAASYLVTTGNEVDVDVGEAIGWLADRDDVSVILAYAEGIRDGERLVAALATAHANGIPVVFMKAARSAAGAQAASTHTASLAGADAVFDAVCADYGVLRATTTEEQVDLAYACVHGLRPRGRRLGVLTVSGGIGVQICDAAERRGLELPPLPGSVQAGLHERFPYASFANPVDMTAQLLQDWDQLDAALDAVLAADRYDAVIASFTTVTLAQRTADRVGQALEATAARHPDRALIVSCLAEPETVRAYEDAGFPVFEDADRAVGALASLASAGEAVARGLPRRAEGRGRPVQVMTGTEDEAKRLLAAAGVPVSADCLAGSADEAVAAAERVGYPVAIKVVSPDVLHKTDAGGVELDVADAVGARAAYASVRRRALAHIPNARIDGVLVSPMAPAGVDVIVGSHRDPTFGPVVAFGLGGIFVEVLDDVALALAPVDEERAHRMIRSVRGYPLLAGARGGEPVDLDALARAIASVSRFAAANTETVASLDINPLRASAAGVVALDASIVPTGR